MQALSWHIVGLHTQLFQEQTAGDQMSVARKHLARVVDGAWAGARGIKVSLGF